MKKIINFLKKACQPTLLMLIAFLILLACNKSIQTSNPQAESGNVKETATNPFTEIGKVGVTPFSDDNVVKAYTLEATDGCTYIVVTSYSCDSRGGSSVAIRHSAACPNEIHDAVRVE